MVDVLKVQQVSSFTIFDLRLSEGEIQILVDLVDHALDTLDDEQLHQAVTDDDQRGNAPARETRVFLEKMRAELCACVRDHCDPEYLPERFQ
jgi:hypothetical protein